MNSPNQKKPPEGIELNDVQRLIIAELRAVRRAEVISCVFCDIDSPSCLEEALIKGWTSLQIDDGINWNYLGICPDCRDKNAMD